MKEYIRKQTNPLRIFAKGAMWTSLMIGAAAPCQAQLFSDDLEAGVGNFIEVDNSGGENAGKFSASVGSDGLGGDAGGGLMVGGDITGSAAPAFIPGAWYQIDNVSADPQGDIMVEYEVRFGPEGGADDCVFVMGNLDEGNFYGIFKAELARNNDLIYHQGNVRVDPVVLDQYAGAFNDDTWHRAVVTWTASTSTLTFNMTEIGVDFPADPLFSVVLDGSSNNNPSLTTLGNIQFGFATFNDTAIYDNITVTGSPPTDTDGDGLSDAYEMANGLDPNDNGTTDPMNGASGDPDMDGLSNIQEFLGNDASDVSHGFGPTMANMPDSDGDGLNDLEEVSGSRNPFQTNASGDAATTVPGLITNPNSMDSDGDGLNDLVEVTGSANNDIPSNPNNTDTDGDTFADNLEIEEGTDPSDSASFPVPNPIIWGEPQTVTGTVEDFVTSGELIHAWSAAAGTISIADLGIDFVPGPSLNRTNFTGADPDDRANADYDTLLDTGNFGADTQSLTIDGLTEGEEYIIQLWVADTRPCCNTRVKTYDSGDGTPQVMLATADPQFVIGTFTATETEQELRFISDPADRNGTSPQYNAIMVRTNVPQLPSRIAISNITHDANADTTEITWASSEGQLYEIRKSLDLTGNPSSWQLVMSDVAGAASPATTTTAIVDTAATEERAFYVVIEIDPPALFEEDFEAGPGGWVNMPLVGDSGNTTWEWGMPINVGPPASADGSVNSFGTNISANYGAGSSIALVSPPIDLTGVTSASLTFDHYPDFEGDLGFDTGVVQAVVNGSSTTLGPVIFEVFTSSAAWAEVSANLPAEALGQVIQLQFSFTSSNQVPGRAGWYIDNVSVNAE